MGVFYIFALLFKQVQRKYILPTFQIQSNKDKSELNGRLKVCRPLIRWRSKETFARGCQAVSLPSMAWFFPTVGFPLLFTKYCYYFSNCMPHVACTQIESNSIKDNQLQWDRFGYSHVLPVSGLCETIFTLTRN